MRLGMFSGWQLALAVLAMTGCKPGAFGSGTANYSATDQAAMVAQNQDLQRRLSMLDRSNQEQTRLLASSQRRVQVAEESLAAVQGQLRDANMRVTQLQQEKTDAQRQADSLLASSRRAGPTIKANNSLLATLPARNIRDAQVRQDGDVIRIGISADKLFHPGTGQLNQAGADLIDSVAAEIARTYPDQIIGIEGHTERDPAYTSPAYQSHQLAVSRAATVFDQLVRRGRLRADQMFVAGYGANHPIYSNAHAEGQAQNRRIELVIYPEKRAGAGEDDPGYSAADRDR